MTDKRRGSKWRQPDDLVQALDQLVSIVSGHAVDLGQRVGRQFIVDALSQYLEQAEWRASGRNEGDPVATAGGANSLDEGIARAVSSKQKSPQNAAGGQQ